MVFKNSVFLIYSTVRERYIAISDDTYARKHIAAELKLLLVVKSSAAEPKLFETGAGNKILNKYLLQSGYYSRMKKNLH